MPAAITPLSWRSIPKPAWSASRSYVVVHDCGRVINPTIVEGQVHGGVAQGIGGSFYEKLAFDDDGHRCLPLFWTISSPRPWRFPTSRSIISRRLHR